MTHTPSPQDAHGCPGGCGAPVTRGRFACPACWRRLPQGYRTAIVATRVAGDHIGHSHAMVNAMHWYRADSDSHADHPEQEETP